MGTNDLTVIGQFIQDQGLLTLMLLGFGAFFAFRVFPWVQDLSAQWIAIQKERTTKNDERMERWVTTIDQNSGALRELTQLIEAQRTEVMRRLESLDRK